MKIIFLGTQGSGKSTQAQLAAEALTLPYFETGQLLRNRSKENDDLAKEIKENLDQGHLVPDEITISILRENLQKKSSVAGYILDGYPRNFAQYNALDTDIDLVIHVKVADEEAIKRLINRARADDKPEALQKRLEIYHRETEPLLAKFKEREILKEVDGERPIEDIHKDILKIIKSHNKYQ